MLLVEMLKFVILFPLITPLFNKNLWDTHMKIKQVDPYLKFTATYIFYLQIYIFFIKKIVENCDVFRSITLCSKKKIVSSKTRFLIIIPTFAWDFFETPIAYRKGKYWFVKKMKFILPACNSKHSVQIFGRQNLIFEIDSRIKKNK